MRIEPKWWQISNYSKPILKLLKSKLYFAKLMWGVCRFKRKIENETALAVGLKGQIFFTDKISVHCLIVM